MQPQPPQPGPPDDPQPYTRDYEVERPAGEGQPPRPGYEPAGSEQSSKNDKTLTDPMTGEPNPAHPSTDDLPES